jgi:hypothetical protein
MKDWDIVLSDNAIASEFYAAEEFQDFFAQAGGVKLPIVHEINRTNRHVFIGPGTFMQASPVGFSVEKSGPEELRIVARDNNIAIAGGRPRGTLYGVYKFLEDYLGIRFLTPDHTHVPPLGDRLIIGPVDVSYNPPFPLYRVVGSKSAVFSVRQRDKYYRNEPKFGGFTPYHIINHSLLKQIPLEKYGKEHPEYYCLWDGKRSVHLHAHYCLTNPELLPIVTKAVFEEIEHPASAKRKNFSVSQNDTIWQYCQCENCLALVDAEGTHMAPLLNFVNAIAEEVAKKHPDVLIGTLSYGFSRKPPKSIKPRSNVQINMCTMGVCHIHPLTDSSCPRNVQFMQEMTKWSEIGEHLSIWDYYFPPDLMPYPHLRTIEKNIRAFAAAGAEGVFMQTTKSPVGFSELRHYLIISLLWDPTRSGEQLIDEFIALHYGHSAPPIRQFVNLIHNHYESLKLHHSRFITDMRHFPIDNSVAEAGLELFRQALDLADNEKVKSRVEKASLCAYRAVLEPISKRDFPVWKIKEGTEIDPNLAEKMRPLAQEFFRLCDKFGLQSLIAEPRQRIKKLLKLKSTKT